MPVCLTKERSAYNPGPATEYPRKAPIESRESDASCIRIGLINNMPDAALKATERQFLALLDAAGAGMVVRLTFYALPGVPRSELARRHVSSCYSDIDDLRATHLDGLIVTGTEPHTQNLMDEPYWGSLTEVLEWAEQNTYSTIWSCLAAHAAVLHIDGIARSKFSEKRFGIFECVRVSDHGLTANASSRVHMPHSRWNGIPEGALTSCGYRILTRSEDAGVDIFLRQRKSLFVFFQGHPEYEANTLLLEYRRDVGRFLRHERDIYPSMPRGYFDETATAALTVLRERVLSDRREELLEEFPTTFVATRITNTWSSTAACIYHRWLLYLCTQKDRRLHQLSCRVTAL
jgi:homoserine O-succinyltransferase